MSGCGNCYDNAAMESFFHSLKTECVYLNKYETCKAAEQAIFDYVDTFYNAKRLHSYLNYSAREFLEGLSCEKKKSDD